MYFWEQGSMIIYTSGINLRKKGISIIIANFPGSWWSICSDEGLTLETSAFESLYGGQFTLSTQLIKPNYLESQPVFRDICSVQGPSCNTAALIESLRSQIADCFKN